MFRNSAWFLCAFLLCFGQTLSQDGIHESKVPETHEGKPPSESHPQLEPETPKSQPKTTNPITPNNNTSTTTAQTTKAESTTTSTVPSTSPTPTSPSTTEATTTQKTSTSTTTPTKTTPTPPPSPTSPTPIPVTPTPVVEKGSWNVTINNITCLRIDGIFSIDYTYETKNKTNHTIHFDVPKGAASNGTCNEIALYWRNNTAINELKFIFATVVNKTVYVLHSMAGEVYIPEHNKTAHFNTNINKTYFETPIGQSYSCSSMKKVDVNQHVKVTFDEFHLQAFKKSNTTGFDTSVDCASNTPHTADIVPIVVGCVLALLVIAVLVAYLISRRRSQTRGYLSM